MAQQGLCISSSSMPLDLDMNLDLGISMSNTSSPPPGTATTYMEEESSSTYGNQITNSNIISSSSTNNNSVGTPSETNEGEPSVYVGQKIEVQWSVNGEYYPCSVVDYSADTQKAKVIYPRYQNAVEEFFLPNREWRIAKRSRGRPILDTLVGKQIEITNNSQLANTFLSKSFTLRCYVLRRAGPGRYDLLFLESDRIAKGQNLVGVEYTIVAGEMDNVNSNSFMPRTSCHGHDTTTTKTNTTATSTTTIDGMNKFLSISPSTDNNDNLDTPPQHPSFLDSELTAMDENVEREEFHRLLFNRFYLHNIPLLPE